MTDALKASGFANKDQQMTEIAARIGREIERGRDLYQDEARAIIENLAAPEPGSNG